MDAMIDLDAVTKQFAGKRDVTALDAVTLTIPRGEMVSIIGPSGSGKSTLLNLVGGLDHATTGEVEVDGAPLGSLDDDALTRVRRDKIGFIFQFFNLLPTLSAFDNVALPMRLKRRPAADARAAAARFLALVGLAQRADHLPDELSGGECQRVAIARALVLEPRVLLADEPTGNLDTKSGEEIVALLEKVNAQGLTLVLVTHDPRVAAHARRVLRMRDGLTLSAIAIGVTAVLLLTALGDAAKGYVVQEFAGVGTNLVIVLPGKVETSG